MAGRQANVYYRDDQVRTAEVALAGRFRTRSPPGDSAIRPAGKGAQRASAAATRGAWQGGLRVATTFERVRAIVADRLGVDEDKVAMDSEFIGDLNADSLDLVEVIMAMEQEFDVEISDEDAEKIRTVGDAVSYINEHQGA